MYVSSLESVEASPIYSRRLGRWLASDWPRELDLMSEKFPEKLSEKFVAWKLQSAAFC